MSKRYKEKGIPIFRSGIYLGFTDAIVASYNLEDIKYARYRFRDEVNRITWVYDPFLGYV